jgi:hypothetical protein
MTWCMILCANTNLLVIVEFGMLSLALLAILQISSAGALVLLYSNINSKCFGDMDARSKLLVQACGAHNQPLHSQYDFT